MVILDFIYKGSADLFGTRREGKIQNENMFPAGFEPANPRQDSQRFRPLGKAGKISSGTFIV